MKSTKNLIRLIREAAGLSQTGFGLAIDRSLPMVRQYENNYPVPDDVLEKIEKIASDAGRPDLAASLREWGIQTVIHPMPAIQPPRGAGVPANHAGWHEILEEILSSGQDDAIHAVQANLIVFQDRVRLRAPQEIPSKKRQK